MKNLYAKVVLFFIRPALELKETSSGNGYVDAFVDDMKKGGRTAHTMESLYGIRRKGA